MVFDPIDTETGRAIGGPPPATGSGFGAVPTGPGPEPLTISNPTA
jgi:hypothetical protein